MRPPCRRLALTAALALAAPAGGCTVCKPVVGALAAPFVVLGPSGYHGCGCDDGRAALAAFAVIAAAGAVCGLVTGILTDVEIVCGNNPEPLCYWWDPFAIGQHRFCR